MNATFPVSQAMNPFGAFEAMTGLADLWGQVVQSFLPVSGSFRRGEGEFHLPAGWEDELADLMNSVRPIGHAGHYKGARFTTKRTLREAAMSGDWNPIHVDPKQPHPEFGKRIAHGLGGVSQALGAMRHRTRGMCICPDTLTAEFRGPAFVGHDRLKRVVITTPGTRPLCYQATAHTDPVARPILTLSCTMTNVGRGNDDLWAWLLPLMAAWQVSALIAQTWPRCLYYMQGLRFDSVGEGRPSSLRTTVRGRGKNEKGHLVVGTTVTAGEEKIAHGEAIIVV